MKAKIGKKQDAFRLRHKRSTYYFVVGQGFVARCLKSATWITAGTVQSVRADYGDKASDIEEVADNAECDCWRCRKAAAAAGLVKWTGFTPRQPGMEESMALHKYKVTITHSMLPTVYGCLFAVSEEAALAMLDLPGGRHAVVVQIGNFSACFYDKQFDQFVRYGNRPAPPPEREGQVTESPAPAPADKPCYNCDGTGEDDHQRVCARCDGTGRIALPAAQPKWVYDRSEYPGRPSFWVIGPAVKDSEGGSDIAQVASVEVPPAWASAEAHAEVERNVRMMTAAPEMFRVFCALCAASTTPGFWIPKEINAEIHNLMARVERGAQ